MDGATQRGPAQAEAQPSPHGSVHTQGGLLPLPTQSSLPEVTREELLGLYREMALIRRVEEMAAKAYTQRKILGFCHLYIGQESVAVGAAVATKGDYWMAAYREHGHAMAKGTSARAVMAELYGRRDGASRGLGGSMHIFDREHDFLGGYGIVGAHVPLAAGVAFAAKYRDEGRVAVCYFGDGAAHQGAFFEALCLAQLYKLPAVFICENNFYAMGTPLHRQSALADMSLRADGVGMQRDSFEGFDVELVRERVARAADYARAGNGPVMLEIVTYRHRGHSMSDPAKYRPEGELEQRKEESDPLKITLRRLTEDFGVTEAEIEAIHASVEAEGADAVAFAEQSSVPDPDDLYRFTYAPQETSMGVGEAAPTFSIPALRAQKEA